LKYQLAREKQRSGKGHADLQGEPVPTAVNSTRGHSGVNRELEIRRQQPYLEEHPKGDSVAFE